MLKKIGWLSAMLLSVHVSFGQFDFQEQLAGFMLGQYRICAVNVFGQPIVQEKYDDGFEYEIFLVRPDTSLYMIFEYSPAAIDVIWSIQITGDDHIPDFLGLRLGMSESDVLETLGRRPFAQKDMGPYGTKLEFDSVNYSLEINTNGRLSSIKLIDESYKYFTGSNQVERIPSFSLVRDALNSGSNERIGALLAPDVEVYHLDSTLSFSNSWQEEIKRDVSGVFGMIKSSAAYLLDIAPGDTLAYAENIRLRQGMNPMHVIKFDDQFPISEIVFKYQFDRYMLWEYSLKK